MELTEINKKEWEKLKHVAVFPSLYLVLTLVLGSAIMWEVKNVPGLSQEAQLTCIMGAGIIMIVGVIWWCISIDIAFLRYDILEMKKQP